MQIELMIFGRIIMHSIHSGTLAKCKLKMRSTTTKKDINSKCRNNPKERQANIKWDSIGY